MDDLSRRMIMGAGAAGLAAGAMPALGATGREARPLAAKLRARIAAVMARDRMPAVGVAAVHRGVPVAIENDYVVVEL